MRNKFLGIVICMLLISSTTILALTPFNRYEKQTKNQFFDTTLVSLSTSGTWMKTFGGSNENWGWSVQQTSDGEYPIIAEIKLYGTDGNVWLIKINSQGKSKIISLGDLWLERLFQRFPNVFPILKRLLGY